jgi:succinylarginine dihydrolase
LFNAQLVTIPDGPMALVVPLEATETPSVRGFLERLTRGNGPIRQVLPVDVRESMANGGGPACLRLRVVADPETIDPRFLLTEASAAQIERIVTEYWPEQIDPGELGTAALTATVRAAWLALVQNLNLAELI